MGSMGTENTDFWEQVFPFHTPDVQEYLDELLFMPDALLMGQKTYTFFAQVWPERQGEQADRINSMPKYVALPNPEGAASMECYAPKGGCR